MITTERLRLQPLSHDQLVKYIRCDFDLEKELQLTLHPRSVSHELVDALEITFLPNASDPEKNYLFYTLWTAISIADNVLVGDICFVGEPNDAGEVEIGYGTYPDFQGKGYMTEIVKGMIIWVRKQPYIKTILASTDKTNIASSKVLIKNQFVQCGENETTWHWKLTLRNS